MLSSIEKRPVTPSPRPSDSSGPDLPPLNQLGLTVVHDLLPNTGQLRGVEPDGKNLVDDFSVGDYEVWRGPLPGLVTVEERLELETGVGSKLNIIPELKYDHTFKN